MRCIICPFTDERLRAKLSSDLQCCILTSRVHHDHFIGDPLKRFQTLPNVPLLIQRDDRCGDSHAVGAKQKGPSQWSETALKLTQGICGGKSSERAERLSLLPWTIDESTPGAQLATALPSPGLAFREFASDFGDCPTAHPRLECSVPQASFQPRGQDCSWLW